MAGMTMRVSSVDETMPPIIGTAMRCMTSEPVPVLHMMGSRPGHDGDHRHHLRPHALDRADHDGVVEVGARVGPPSRAAARAWTSSAAWSR